MLYMYIKKSYNQACKGYNNEEYGIIHLEENNLALFLLLKVCQIYIYKPHGAVQIYFAGDWS